MYSHVHNHPDSFTIGMVNILYKLLYK